MTFSKPHQKIKQRDIETPICVKISKKPELRDKLIKIKKRQIELRRIDKMRWTKKDFMFMKMAKEPKMQRLLN